MFFLLFYAFFKSFLFIFSAFSLKIEGKFDNPREELFHVKHYNVARSRTGKQLYEAFYPFIFIYTYVTSSDLNTLDKQITHKLISCKKARIVSRETFYSDFFQKRPFSPVHRTFRSKKHLFLTLGFVSRETFYKTG